MTFRIFRRSTASSPPSTGDKVRLFGLDLVRLDALTYRTADSVVLSVRLSEGIAADGSIKYSFVVSQSCLTSSIDSAYLVFVCGNEDRSLVFAASDFRDLTKEHKPDAKGNWHVVLLRFPSSYKISIEGSEMVDVTGHLNKFERFNSPKGKIIENADFIPGQSCSKGPSDAPSALVGPPKLTGNDVLDGVIWSCGDSYGHSCIRLNLDGVPLPIIENLAREIQTFGYKVEFIGGEETSVMSALILKGLNCGSVNLPAEAQRPPRPSSAGFLEGYLLPRMYAALSIEEQVIRQANKVSERIRVRVRTNGSTEDVAAALKEMGIGFKVLHIGCIEIDPASYDREPFAEYLRVYQDDPDLDLEGSSVRPTRPRARRKRSIRAAGKEGSVLDSVPAGAIVHLAGKAKFNNKLKPYERGALYNISKRVLYNRDITEKQKQFLENLIGKCQDVGLIEDQCERGKDCDLCRMLRDAFQGPPSGG